jgi:hypothetical protein
VQALQMRKTSTGLDLEALIHSSVGRATTKAVTSDGNGADPAR